MDGGDFRKGMSRREWGALEKEIQTRRAGFWKEYVMMCDSDYDCAYLFGILRFKLRWMVFYWENFGHGDEGDGTLSQMRLAVRLLDIVRRHGLDGPLPACPHGCTPAHLPAHPPACSSICLFTADNPYFQTVVNRMCLSLPCNGSTLAPALFQKGLARAHPQHRPLYGIML